MPSVAVNFNTSGDKQLVAAPTGSRRIRVLGFLLVSYGAVNIKFKDGASTDLTGAMPLTTNAQIRSPGGGIFLGVNSQGQFDTTSGNDLILNLDAGTQVTGYVTYLVIP